ncbi:MAG TPA: Hsp20/alpha crystallin family protein [Candidatus Cloacimonadota bacterium]|nr:Hsp20/alpha crystallin family protein [Candidatus Cloacimonadota bacterium]
MLKILGEVTSLTNHPVHMDEGMDEIWHPHCDIYETNDEYRIIVELAGVGKNTINITATNDYLRISGTRSIPTPNCSICYHNMEIETGQYERLIPMPATPIESESPKVTYENGMLIIVYKIKPIVEKIIHID